MSLQWVNETEYLRCSYTSSCLQAVPSLKVVGTGQLSSSPPARDLRALAGLPVGIL